MADSITYIAPCPECGSSAAWNATVSPTRQGDAHVNLGHLIKCPNCDKRGRRK